VIQTEWSRGFVRVRPAEHGRVPTWLGLPGVLSMELCQGMMQVLMKPGVEDAWLSQAAAAELASLRQGYAGLLAAGTAPLEELPEGVQWHTFAGGAVNRLLAAALEAQSGKRWTSGNLSVRCREIALTVAHDAVRGLSALSWERVAADAAHAMTRGMVSKFQPCLPEDAEDRLLAERLLDLPGTLRFLGSVTVNGMRPVERPAGLRLVDAETPGALTLAFDVPVPALRSLVVRDEVRWIDTPAALRALCDELGRVDIIALDVETSAAPAQPIRHARATWRHRCVCGVSMAERGTCSSGSLAGRRCAFFGER
jgi:ATP-dependent Lhr-like helicase